MNASELQTGDQIITRGPNGKITETITVRKIEHCPSRRRGVGATHINDDRCYDNAATLETK